MFGIKRPIELTTPWLPSRIRAITLWPLILYRKGEREDFALRCHEWHHWREIERSVVYPWYIAYLLLYPTHATTPSLHPLERAAYALQYRVEGLISMGATQEMLRADDKDIAALAFPPGELDKAE